MNFERLQKSVGQRFHLRPAAMSIDELDRPSAVLDEAWIVDAVLENEVRLTLPRTGHFTSLGKDHIHHYTSNPDETKRTGIVHGFLTLNVQIFLCGTQLRITPTARPGEAVFPPRSARPLLPQPSTAIHSPIPFISELPYSEARGFLIEAGWQPLRNHWSYSSRPEMEFGNGAYYWSKGFWEITNVSPTGLAHCTFRFRDVYKNILVIVTAGEADVEQASEAVVWNWFFEKANDA